jgi:ABC-type transport system involved in multi-copper enzyme maturation permease subunit
MKRLSNNLLVNPILVKEIRSRMRGPRAFLTLTLILLAMGGLMYGMLQLILAGARYSNILSPQVGQTLFATLAFIMLFMICAITPAVTAGAISGEKEKQTYEMLMATPLSATSILWGKLVSALSYVLLLLFAGIPLASVVFIFGGVAPREMVKTLLVLVVVAVSYGVIGLFLSALFGRTGRATVVAFLAVFALMIGPIFLAGLVGVLRESEPPRWLLIPSPISAISSTLAPSMGFNAGGSLFYILGGIFNMGASPISMTSIPRPMYHFTLPFYGLLSLILYMITARLVQPTRRWRIRRRDALVGAGVLLLAMALVAGAFVATASRYEWAVNNQSKDQPVVRPEIAPQMVGPNVVVQERVVEAVPAGAVPPTPTPAGADENTAAADALAEADQVQIYAAIARHMYVTDHTFGPNNPPNWSRMYLMLVTDDRVGDPNTPRADPVTFTEETTSAIQNELQHLPVHMQWIDQHDQANLDPNTGQVDEGTGVIFTFGNIHPQADGTVHVPASLYFANLGAAGKTYVLTKIDGVWTVTGTTGVEWMS